jgi:hypothetical protein
MTGSQRGVHPRGRAAGRSGALPQPQPDVSFPEFRLPQPDVSLLELRPPQPGARCAALRRSRKDARSAGARHQLKDVRCAGVRHRPMGVRSAAVRRWTGDARSAWGCRPWCRRGLPRRGPDAAAVRHDPFVAAVRHDRRPNGPGCSQLRRWSQSVAGSCPDSSRSSRIRT